MTEQEQHVDRLQSLATGLIQTASELQSKINSSKTQAKRDYYNKKMTKVRSDVQQVLATLQLVKIMEDQKNAATTDSTPAISV
jgi:hypothetical protein